jgi:hypothetical protein
VVVVAFAAYSIASEINRARAEGITTKAWVMCKPGDFVYLRQWASRKATEAGFMDPCDSVEIDGKTKDGFAHVVYPTDAWIWAGYLVFEKPKAVNEKHVVVSNSRLAARRWIDGPNVQSKPWLKNGSTAYVYYEADGWACTSRGFLRSEWLEADPQ